MKQTIPLRLLPLCDQVKVDRGTPLLSSQKRVMEEFISTVRGLKGVIETDGESVN